MKGGYNHIIVVESAYQVYKGREVWNRFNPDSKIFDYRKSKLFETDKYFKGKPAKPDIHFENNWQVRIIIRLFYFFNRYTKRWLDC